MRTLESPALWPEVSRAFARRADKLAYPPDGRKKSMDTHTRGVTFGLLVIILASAAILAGSYVW